MGMITGIEYEDRTYYPDIVIGKIFAEAMDEVLMPLESEINALEAWVTLHVLNDGLKVTIKKAPYSLRTRIQKLLRAEGLLF